jgi:hypothetical protein
LVVLQDPTASENVQGLCTEICPAFTHDAYQAISVKAEVLSDIEEEEDPLTAEVLSRIEEEEDPLAIPFPGGIKVEPEVSCVTVYMLGAFHKFRYSMFMNFSYSEQLTFINSVFAEAETYIHSTGLLGESRHRHLCASLLILQNQLCS